MRKVIVILEFYAFLGLLCVEFSLAAFFPQPSFYFFEYASGGYIFHKPNFQGNIAQVQKKTKTTAAAVTASVAHDGIIKQYIMSLRTNNAGFRNDVPVTYEKTPDKYRIMLLGDSMGFGFPLPLEDTYAGGVQDLVPGTEVLNASTVFTHTARSLGYYQKEGYKYNPDMVILQLTISFSNEDYLWLDSFGKNQLELSVLNELEKGDAFKPLITKDEAGVDQLSWEYSDQTQSVFDALNHRLDPSNVFYRYFNIARLFENTSDVLSQPLKIISRGYATRVGPLTKSYQTASSTMPRLSTAPVTFSPIATAKFDGDIGARFTGAYLKTFQHMLSAAHKQLVVVVIPNRLGCFGETYAAWERLLSTLPKNEYHTMNFYQDFCDVTAKKAREEFYLPQEFHLNATGHAFVAERLSAKIVALKNATQ